MSPFERLLASLRGFGNVDVSGRGRGGVFDAGVGAVPNFAQMSDAERRQYLQMQALVGGSAAAILGGAALAPAAAGATATGSATGTVAQAQAARAAVAQAAQHNARVVATTQATGAPATGTVAQAQAARAAAAQVTPGMPAVLPGGGAATTAGASAASPVVAQAQAQAAAHNAQVIITQTPTLGPTTQLILQGLQRSAAGAPSTIGVTAPTLGTSAATGAPQILMPGAAQGSGVTTQLLLSRLGQALGTGGAPATTAGTAGAAAASPTAAAAGSASAAARSGGFFRGMRRPFTSQPGVRTIGRHNIGRATGMGALGAGATYLGGAAAAIPREFEVYQQQRAEDAVDGQPYPLTLRGLLGVGGRALADPFSEGPGAIADFLFQPSRPRPDAPATPADAPGTAPDAPRTTPLPAPSVDDLRGNLPGGGDAAGGVTGGVPGGVGGTGGGVPGLPGVPRNLFQLQETDEERALIARAIADIQRRRDEGTTALRSGWTNVQSANTAAAEKARALVEERGGRAESIWTGAEERTREEAARRAAAAGGFEGRAAIDVDTLGGAEDFVRFMQSQAPAERALAEAEQAAFAEDLEFLAALAGSQGQAYASDLGRLSAAMEFERQAQHDRDVQDRINMERMALAQMEFAAGQAAAAASRQEQKDVSTILTGLSGSFPAPNADPETARRTLSRIAASLFSQMGGTITEEQAIQYVVDWGESIAFRNLEQEFLQKIK